MRHFRLLLPALILGMLAPLTASAEGKGKWITTKHDFGAFDEDLGTVYCEFKLVNVGDEPLAIIATRANCGCTRPEYSTDPVAPGDTAVIRVGFDPTGRPGRFVKHLKVDIDSDPLRSNLTIQGTVIGASNTLKTRFPHTAGPMKLRTLTIPYGKVDKGHTAGQYIEGYNASSDTIYPVVKNVPSYINVLLQPAAVPPGEQFVVSTVLHSEACKEWGIVTDELNIYPDASAADGLRVETVAIINEDFSKLTPEQMAKAPVIDTDVTALDLEQISHTDAPLTRTFTISNIGKSPLLIRRISCADNAVSVKLKSDKIKPGKSAKVEVSVDPSFIGDTELLNARINIVANDPLHPSTMVRVVAEVK